MHIGLLMLVLTIVGCANPPASFPDTVHLSSQDACLASQQRLERGRPTGSFCQSRSSWWNDVGEALNGAATAVRLPGP